MPLSHVCNVCAQLFTKHIRVYIYIWKGHQYTVLYNDIMIYEVSRDSADSILL